jgi:SAM-dependent methyltransferase
MSIVTRVRARADAPARRAVHWFRRNSSARALVVRTAYRRLDGPLSDWYGFDRGTPLDRSYIEAFLEEHASDVRGHVLEVKDDEYARRLGGPCLQQVTVVDVDASNRRATLVADLNAADSLPRLTYDCILLTQTLMFLTPSVALPSLYDALKPGGVLLLTTSALTRQETPDTDRWRLPPAGLADLLIGHLPKDAEVEVTGRGNAVVASAFLLGLVVEELSARQLAPADWRFPVVSLARVRRPA